MNPLVLLGLSNLAFVGILAGMEVAIHYGIRGPAQKLNEQSQLQLRQALVLRLRILLPAFFVPAAVSGLAVLILDGARPEFFLRWAGMVCLIAWVATRAIGTVGINKASLTWDVAAPPENWKAQVDKSERFHVMGTWAALLAFAFFLTAVGFTLTTQQ